MDSIFPLLESAFSKAFGNLTQVTSQSVSTNGLNAGGYSRKSLSTWTIGILSYTITFYYIGSNVHVSGTHGTILVIPGSIVSAPNCGQIETTVSEIYAVKSQSGSDLSGSIVTFKQS